jgi:hypothetical protein
MLIGHRDEFDSIKIGEMIECAIDKRKIGDLIFRNFIMNKAYSMPNINKGDRIPLVNHEVKNFSILANGDSQNQIHAAFIFQKLENGAIKLPGHHMSDR